MARAALQIVSGGSLNWIMCRNYIAFLYAEKTALNQAESYPLKEIVLGFKTNALFFQALSLLRRSRILLSSHRSLPDPCHQM